MKCQYCIVSIKLEYRRVVWAEGINVGIVNVYMIFKTMRDLQRRGSRTEYWCTSTLAGGWRNVGAIPPGWGLGSLLKLLITTHP